MVSHDSCCMCHCAALRGAYRMQSCQAVSTVHKVEAGGNAVSGLLLIVSPLELLILYVVGLVIPAAHLLKVRTVFRSVVVEVSLIIMPDGTDLTPQVVGDVAVSGIRVWFGSSHQILLGICDGPVHLF